MPTEDTFLLARIDLRVGIDPVRNAGNTFFGPLAAHDHWLPSLPLMECSTPRMAPALAGEWSDCRRRAHTDQYRFSPRRCPLWRAPRRARHNFPGHRHLW